ncbi:MAG: sugar nucleotide-binding protein [Gemmataceae bacterium]
MPPAVAPFLPASRLPLLVTGVAGVAGFNAFRHLHARYPGQVIGVRPRQTWRLHGPGIIAQDAEDAAGMRRLFDQFGFRSVLNTVGNCALKSCELDPAMAHTVNVASALVMVDNVLRHACRLVHLSSDLVFSGAGEGHYVETAPTDPVTVYGKTMVQAETLLRDRLPAAAILRISLPMGPSFNRHAGAIDWIQSRFRAGRPATLYFDEVRSCTYCDDLNHVFERFLAEDHAGVFHCGGPRPNTLYQIAQVVNRVGDYGPDLLKGCPRLEAGPMPPRAGNVTMCSEKLIRALGEQPFHPWPREQELHPVDRHWHRERPHTERRGVDEIARRLYRHPNAWSGAAC